MHLLEIDTNTLNFQSFMETYNKLHSVTEEERREYILLYLTD